MSQVAVPVRPDDPPFFIHLASRTQDGDSNPRKWGISWGNDERAMLDFRQNLERRDAQGNLCQRVCIEPEKRSMDGADVPHMGVGTGAAWNTIDPFRKQIIIEAVEDRRREDRTAGRPELTVGFYVNSCCNGMGKGMIQNHGSSDVVNLDTDEGLEAFKIAFEPWVECGVLSEIWYDAGFFRDYKEKVINLLGDQKDRYGLHGGTEAIELLHTGQPFEFAPYSMPCWAISRYLLYRDPLQELTFEPGQEVWTMNGAHRLPDGTAGLLTEQQAHKYTENGIGVGSWTRWHDADLMVNLPPRGPSTPDM